MFPLRENGLPCGATRTLPLLTELASLLPRSRCAHQIRCASATGHVMNRDAAARKAKGGRPRGDPASLRMLTIGVRVSSAEHEALCVKAAAMQMRPAQWLREAALSRRLPPSPPVAAINREQYAELARLRALRTRADV